MIVHCINIVVNLYGFVFCINSIKSQQQHLCLTQHTHGSILNIKVSMYIFLLLSFYLIIPDFSTFAVKKAPTPSKTTRREPGNNFIIYRFRLCFKTIFAKSDGLWLLLIKLDRETLQMLSSFHLQDIP